MAPTCLLGLEVDEAEDEERGEEVNEPGDVPALAAE